MAKIKKYFNAPQQEVMAIQANTTVIIGSRGVGKSEGIDAPWLLHKVHLMPRASIAFLSPTYKKLLQNTLPAISHALARLGYFRNVHYYIGRRAPKNRNFQTPFIDPGDYSNAIHWWNGHITIMISFDRGMSANSMSLNGIFAPEARYLSYEKIKEEVKPAIRSIYFKDSPWYGCELYTSDRPTNSKGKWLEDFEKKMDPELINYIKHLYLRYRRLKEVDSRTTSQTYRMRALLKELNDYRRVALFYGEYNAIDNIELLDEDYIKRNKRDLPPLIFRISILNEKIRKVRNGFYSALNEHAHYYTNNDNGYLESLDYNLIQAGKGTCLMDADLERKLPVCIALDYNAAISNLVVGQADTANMRTLKHFYVKTPRKLPELVNDFCDYYRYHHSKEVVYYYDSTAIHRDADRAESFSEIVMNVLRKRGWTVKGVYLGNPKKHTKKHTDIDMALKGKNYLYPLFNEENCDFLIRSMETTGVIIGRNGFQKDKSNEKEPDTPESPDELKTHSTDAWDTLFEGINFHHTTMYQGETTANI